MEVTIRTARADDAAFLSWVVLTAGRGDRPRGWYDITLGLDEAGCLDVIGRLITGRTESWWRYDRFLIAEVDGEPAAALSAFRSTDYETSIAAMVEAVSPLGWGEAELDAAWTRGGYVFRCTFGGDDAPTWTIENVAARPQFRRRGLVQGLLEAAAARGRAAGFHEAQITFFIGNTAAETAYAKAGFVFDQEKRHPDFEAAVGAPGLRRFVRRL